MNPPRPSMSDDRLKILNPAVRERLGRVRCALFDFDGTLSLLREGWEGVMVPLMLEMICEEHRPTPVIEREVHAYVDRSTGMLTTQQMQWLADAVRRHGLVRERKTASEYKAIYVLRIAGRVRERVEMLRQGVVAPETMMLLGAEAFVAGLARRGVSLYLASGTDHEYALNEARALGLDRYFHGNVYGALDASETHDKGQIIGRLLTENALHGDELLVVGDGPVEMREAVARGTIALGVASDEIRRRGWNPSKVERLTEAGADLLIPDYADHEALLEILVGERSNLPA